VPVGLRAQFGGIKILTDSVQLLLTTACDTHDRGPLSNFMQRHIYTLREISSGRWEVVHSALQFIT